MFRSFTKKRVAVGLGAATLAGLGAVAALAFFTGSGSGSGTAAVANSPGITVAGVTFAGDLYPGANQAVTVSLSNPSSIPVSVGTIVADPTVANTYVTTGSTLVQTGSGVVFGTNVNCDASQFSFSPATVNAQIPAGSGTTAIGTLTMSNPSAENQDSCQGKAPVLHLVTNP
jgi:hypothetical protein